MLSRPGQATFKSVPRRQRSKLINSLIPFKVSASLPGTKAGEKCLLRFLSAKNQGHASNALLGDETFGSCECFLPSPPPSLPPRFSAETGELMDGILQIWRMIHYSILNSSLFREGTGRKPSGRLRRDSQ